MRNSAKLFRLSDGRIRIRHLTPEIWERFDDSVETETVFYERWMAHSDREVGTVLGDFDETNGPVLPDRTFRGALDWVAGGPVIDMPKARAIHTERLVTALDKQDREDGAAHNVAEMANDTVETARLKAKFNSRAGRKTARDAQIASAATPEILNAIWDADIPR